MRSQKYNINSVDTDLQNYRDGKLSVECGIVPYIDMKSKAKALNSVLVKLENLSKKDIELLNNEGINYSAFARQGKYNVVVEKSDAERTYIALGKTMRLLLLDKPSIPIRLVSQNLESGQKIND